MRGIEFERFVDLINRDKVLVDIRIGQYADGRPHDHGTAFRIAPDDLVYCSAYRERAI